MSAEQSKILVLIADDEENLLLLLKDNFEDHGFEVAIAKNGEEALRNSMLKKPNAIILDVEMPKMNGWQVCEKIRKNPDLKDVPIVILSAYAQPEDIKKGLAAGANKYMSKPFKMNELIQTIKGFVANTSS